MAGCGATQRSHIPCCAIFPPGRGGHRERLVGKKRCFIILLVVSITATASFYLVKSEQIFAIFGPQIVGSLTEARVKEMAEALEKRRQEAGEEPAAPQ